MTFYKTIVCLANSRKEGGRCVAGKEIVNNQISQNWIRPVSRSQMGELSAKNTILHNGKLPKWLSSLIMLFKTRKPQPKMLDIISVPVIQHKPHAYQSENYLIDDKQRWIKQQTLPATQLPQLCDSVPSLWINGYHSSNGVNDRIPLEIATKSINTSLLLIKPENLSILVKKELNRTKIRAEFDFNRQQYRLIVTEPKVESIYRFKAGGKYPITEEVYLCISLGEPFEGYSYKLVAAVINA
ncbi:MAG: hypothetical protein DRR08_27110 [Candidatus Parabeggiatoa sp. nov. 2]|nr:MAG: hypothetical protein B6247_25115 [Beggiatoa sp. 4572_84]RKZ53716.1 MAG: hypothetical protein DRR08_27110 [Gammaproteobacteria bacterium]HEC85993.1 hypothetical protein [Thioploca sp.]